MSKELERIKQDLSTMERVMRCGPDLDERHVWQGVAFGIWGMLYLALSFVPQLPRFLAAFLLLAALLALPYFLPRLACRNLSTEPHPGDKELSAVSGGLLVLALMLGMIFWVSQMPVAPPNLVPALIFILGGLWALFTAWGRRWWRGMLAMGAAFLAAGFAMPFLPRGTMNLAIGGAMILGGFVGAAILHRQLKAYHANGKAAH